MGKQILNGIWPSSKDLACKRNFFLKLKTQILEENVFKLLERPFKIFSVCKEKRFWCKMILQSYYSVLLINQIFMIWIFNFYTLKVQRTIFIQSIFFGNFITHHYSIMGGVPYFCRNFRRKFSCRRVMHYFSSFVSWYVT